MHTNLSEFDQGQIEKARRLLNKTVALVRSTQSAVVSVYQKRSKEGTLVNWLRSQVMGSDGSLMTNDMRTKSLAWVI